jgi:hypothetical protein
MPDTNAKTESLKKKIRKLEAEVAEVEKEADKDEEKKDEKPEDKKDEVKEAIKSLKLKLRKLEQEAEKVEVEDEDKEDETETVSESALLKKYGLKSLSEVETIRPVKRPLIKRFESRRPIIRKPLTEDVEINPVYGYVKSMLISKPELRAIRRELIESKSITEVKFKINNFLNENDYEDKNITSLKEEKKGSGWLGSFK